MDDAKQKEEQNEPKKPIGEQVTDFIAAGAGALAENAIQSVAKSVRGRGGFGSLTMDEDDSQIPHACGRLPGACS